MARWTWGALSYRGVARLAGVDDAPARRGVADRGAVGAGHAAHPVPLEGSTENTTGLPDPPPVADSSAGLPTAGLRGGKGDRWAMPLTVMACWACGAGWYRAFPAWFASMTHLPAAV